MRNFLLRNRDRWEAIVLAHVLPFVAGAVNASGFFIVGAYTSHVTGSVARVGDDLAQGNVGRALQAAFLVLCFYIGAAFATAGLDRSRSHRRSPYAFPLGVEAMTLLAVTVIGIARPKAIPSLNAVTTALLCFAMGVQNALVSRLSGAVVRTTHLTGIVTDMGIESVRAYAWLKAQGVGAGPRDLFVRLLRFRTAPELEKLRLHSAILASFFLGAYVGPALYLRHGYASMLFPVLVLLLLIAFDVVIGLRAREPAPQTVALPSVPERVGGGLEPERNTCPAARSE